MKMTSLHFNYIANAVALVDTPEKRALYKENGLSTMRYQWDLVRGAGLIHWMCDALYTYLNDDHIQTALNRIIKPL